MAKVIERSAEQVSEFEKWVATRPDLIQQMVRQFPPDRLYRMRSTGHRVLIHAYSESGTVTVLVLYRWNRVLAFERQVFGIDPIADLEECEPPLAEGATAA